MSLGAPTFASGAVVIILLKYIATKEGNDAKESRSAVTQRAQRADPSQNAEQESPHCAIRSGALRSKGPAACRWTPLGVDEEPPHPTSDAALAPPPVSLGDVCFTQ